MANTPRLSLHGITACVFDAYGTCSMSAASPVTPAMCSAMTGRPSPSSGAASNCNTPGCAGLAAGMPISGRLPATRSISRWPRCRSVTRRCARLMNRYLEIAAYPEVPGCCSVCRRRVSAAPSSPTARRRCSLPRWAMPGWRAPSRPCSRSRKSASSSRTRGLSTGGRPSGLAAADICFLSANGWDACSAKAFSFRVLWCNRFGQRRNAFRRRQLFRDHRSVAVARYPCCRQGVRIPAADD